MCLVAGMCAASSVVGMDTVSTESKGMTEVNILRILLLAGVMSMAYAGLQRRAMVR